MLVPVSWVIAIGALEAVSKPCLLFAMGHKLTFALQPQVPALITHSGINAVLQYFSFLVKFGEYFSLSLRLRRVCYANGHEKAQCSAGAFLTNFEGQ